jgi:hypothetical protein
MHHPGETRRGNAEVCPSRCLIGESGSCGVMHSDAPHFPPSSPGLTGRPSIPEAAVSLRKGRGVLGPPVKPGDDELGLAYACSPSSRAERSRRIS